nr:hypothetical protein [uncultured Cellulosilyticum sp.]
MNKFSFVKKVFVCAFILPLSLFLTLPISAKKEDNPSNYPQTMVKLTPCYKTPTSLKSKNTLRLQGLGYGEYIELKVIGTIQNIRLVQLVYNEDTDALEEFATTATVDKLSNNCLVIFTYFPCGMAQEKLIWESLSGQEDSFLIAEDGNVGLKPITYTYIDPFEMPKLLTPPALPTKFISPSDIPAYEALYFMVPLFTN